MPTLLPLILTPPSSPPSRYNDSSRDVEALVLERDEAQRLAVNHSTEAQQIAQQRNQV